MKVKSSRTDCGDKQWFRLVMGQSNVGSFHGTNSLTADDARSRTGR